MNQGVEILIERMRSNPEDFSPDGRFGDTSRRIREGITGENTNKLPWFTRHLLTETEWEALKAAYIEMSRDAFTRRVMKNLLKEKEEPQRIYPQAAGFGVNTTSGSNGSSGYMLAANTGTVGSSIVANSHAGTLTLNANGKSSTLTPEMVEYLKDKVEEYRNDRTI